MFAELVPVDVLGFDLPILIQISARPVPLDGLAAGETMQQVSDSL